MSFYFFIHIIASMITCSNERVGKATTLKTCKLHKNNNYPSEPYICTKEKQTLQQLLNGEDYYKKEKQILQQLTNGEDCYEKEKQNYNNNTLYLHQRHTATLKKSKLYNYRFISSRITRSTVLKLDYRILKH